LYIRKAENRLEIGRGELRAQFERQDNLWVPLWMWQGDRRMVRFKNHEWLSLGHVRPRAAGWEIEEDSAERVGVRFWGSDSYFGVPVEWSVRIQADARWPGFTITSEIFPVQTIELVECFSRFETPSDYAGRENAICVIGQNAVTTWRGEQDATERLAGGLPLRSPAERVARSLSPTRTPICCFRAGPDHQGNERFITLLGHWDVCCFRNLCVAPTEEVENRHGYEFLVGALDWRCCDASEPNVFFEGQQRYRQRVSIAFSSEMAGGTLDRWLFGSFERSLRVFFPPGAMTEIEQRAHAKQVSLAAANAWLLETLSGPEVPGLYSPEEGMVSYTLGSCPGAGQFSISALASWLGPLGYQTYVTRQDTLRAICQGWADRIVGAIERPAPIRWTVSEAIHGLLPLLRYLTCFRSDSLFGVIQEVLGQKFERALSPGEAGRSADLGGEAFRAEACLLLGQLTSEKGLQEAGLACLDQINAQAQERFWQFGCTGGLADAAAGQFRPFGFSHAILCNLLAYRRAHEERYLEMAGTFARYLVSLCYATFNDSDDPDFDPRGFANAAAAGRDRLRDCSPAETSDGLHAVAYWLSFRPDNPSGFYDLLWLLSRTFSGVFPAARERRVGYTTDGQQGARDNAALATAIAYGRFPYIAYENPVRQTRQSPRASVEVLQNYLSFGGGLASCDNERLLVLVPRAAGYDLAERSSRLVHLYNPTDAPEAARLTIHHLSPERWFDVFLGDKPIVSEAPGNALTDIPLEVPPRRAIVLHAALMRSPTTRF